MFGPTHVVVTPKGSEVIVFLKVWIIGSTWATLRSRKFIMSGTSGVESGGGDGISRIWHSTEWRQRRKEVRSVEIEGCNCLHKTMLSILESEGRTWFDLILLYWLMIYSGWYDMVVLIYMFFFGRIRKWYNWHVFLLFLIVVWWRDMLSRFVHITHLERGQAHQDLVLGSLVRWHNAFTTDFKMEHILWLLINFVNQKINGTCEHIISFYNTL